MGWFEPKIVILAEDNSLCDQMKNEFKLKSLMDVTGFRSVIDCMTNNNIQPDIVFVEHHMNHIDGIRASRMMKRKWRRARIILMGASQNAQNKLNKRKYGISRILLRTEKYDDFVVEARKIKLYRIAKVLGYPIGLACLFLCVYQLIR